jgi:hypothetical protein
MKTLFCALMLLLSFAAYPIVGTGIAGGVTLSGILKSAMIKTKIPLGGISAFYGYEAFDFPVSTPVYCYGGVGLSSGSSLVGITFGGQFNRLNTIGKCNAIQDYQGGFLSIGLNYDLKGTGSKSVGIQGALNLGFDLELFNERIIRAYSSDERKIKKRMYDVIWHIAKYAGRVGTSKIKDSHLLKLLLLPMLPVYGSNWKSGLKDMKLNLNELHKYKSPKEVLNFKSRLRDLFYTIRRDVGFYKCSGSGDCMDIYVDAFYLFDALEEAMGECHSVSAGIAPTSSYDLKIPISDTKFNYSFSYSYYGLQKTLSKESSIDLAATKAFGSHRFSTKSASCVGVEKTAAASFANLLVILGIGG